MQTPAGELVKLRSSKDGRRIIAESKRDGKVQKHVKVDIDDMRIFGYRCYATYAGEKGDIIVLLYDFEDE